MERGLYIAASGMLTEQVRQDLIAHDLANASTAGYKPDRVSSKSFGDMLLTDTRTGAPIGPLGLGTQISKQVTDMSSGPIRDTHEPLDFAVEGTGFFAVQTSKGVRYTRDGQFAASARGTLVTAAGDDVLGAGGAPVRIGADGKVAPAAIGVVTVANARREGDNLFTGTAGGAAPGTIRTGALEGSGVDPVTTMVEMIGSLRAFESGQRVITTIDSTLQKATNQVGSI
ncbi:MAG: flagellar basal-body rod protein FlgF [Solirubrobacteraceae bacterium]|jgi:flagellar basal-body rod protein FlgF|nr:flagellar basal-body rod protein FlgF [Solirubrobacteraceae bacterium]MEA2240560.1 flagellar basal-body rod protein FlgF [Solirubrobacteraceae bacterium]